MSGSGEPKAPSPLQTSAAGRSGRELLERSKQSPATLQIFLQKSMQRFIPLFREEGEGEGVKGVGKGKKKGMRKEKG